MRASYSVNEGRTATSNPQRWSGSISYTAGPLFLAYTSDEMKDNPYTGTALLKKQTGDGLMGNFTFGPIKIGARCEAPHANFR